MKNLKLLVILLSVIVTNLCFAQSGWSTLNSPTTNNLCSVYFLNEQTGYAAGLGGVVLKTTNGGINWQMLYGNINVGLRSIYMLNTLTGYAVGFQGNYGKVIKTTDGGSNWVFLSIDSRPLLSICFVNENTGFIGGGISFGLYDYSAVFRTTNSGSNWNSLGGFNILGEAISSVYFLDSLNGFIAGGRIIFITSNCGANWSTQTLNGAYILNSVHATRINNSIVVYVCDVAGHIFESTNGGANWGTLSLINNFICAVFTTVDAVYCVAGNGGIFKKLHFENNWGQQFSPVPNKLNSIYMINNHTGYICGDNGILLKTTNGGGGFVEMVNISREIPNSFSISQNYPNPFNPQTKIKFDVPSNVKGQTLIVKLVIYDLLGREVTTLVNQELRPGTYEADWDGSGYSSGVYFYRIVIGDFIETKKMLMVK